MLYLLLYHLSVIHYRNLRLIDLLIPAFLANNAFIALYAIFAKQGANYALWISCANLNNFGPIITNRYFWIIKLYYLSAIKGVTLEKVENIQKNE